MTALHARYADLVCMSQYDPSDRASRGSYDAPAEVALRSSRPVLVLPRGALPESIGRHVVLAWNGSREATRVATASLPLLRGAEAVDIVVVGEGESLLSARGEKPGEDIALYLGRHGIRASVSRLPTSALQTAEVLLSTVADRGADLLCAGAYVHRLLIPCHAGLLPGCAARPVPCWAIDGEAESARNEMENSAWPLTRSGTVKRVLMRSPAWMRTRRWPGWKAAAPD